MARKFICLIFSLLLSHCEGQTTLNDRFSKLLKRVEKNIDIPPSFVPIEGSEPHRNVTSVVLSVGIIEDMRPKYFHIFLGTLRKTGFDGDIVVAIDPNTNNSNTNTCFKFGAIVYKPQIDCKLPDETKMSGSHRECRISGTNDPKVSLNMLRYRLYSWWASLYEKHTNILIADFRDVFFQSNPFTYIPDQWAPPVSQLTVFLEASPLKAIFRCPFNSGWIRNCYGKPALNMVKTNPVSCSGVSFGSRDGILVYTFLMLEQLNEISRARFDVNGVVPSNEKCFSIGVDQGFHNWLLYSGRLRRVMKVKVFSQGDGPVNTVGAFYGGPKALLKFDIQDDWKILRGTMKEKYISNWNGDPSPVVHQLDRFEFGRPLLMDNMTALHGIWSSEREERDEESST